MKKQNIFRNIWNTKFARRRSETLEIERHAGVDRRPQTSQESSYRKMEEEEGYAEDEIGNGDTEVVVFVLRVYGVEECFHYANSF